jgi:hypothetical protein
MNSNFPNITRRLYTNKIHLLLGCSCCGNTGKTYGDGCHCITRYGEGAIKYKEGCGRCGKCYAHCNCGK